MIEPKKIDTAIESRRSPKRSFIGLTGHQWTLLERMRHEQGADLSTTSGISKRKEDGPAPLSFAQERLWFLYQLEPDSPIYNVHVVIHFEGSLNVSALTWSLTEIIHRHEILRTAFSQIEGKPVQLAISSLDFTLPVVELSSLPKDEQDSAEPESRVRW